MRIAFIGLGHMGAPMVRNLMRAGHALHVFDLSADAMHSLVAEGAQAATSPADAAREADFVITMLPAPRHVEAVLCGNGPGDDAGVLATVRRGVPIVDCSTIDPATVQRLAHRAAAHRPVGCLAPRPGAPRQAR